ncbi:LuxR family transcriptional regulator [Streptomyces bacillaris]|uniref:LuxR family transcriptional regulator n=1 Tax=Streptomyces bacillaris TaxID=68179 RepID=UPI00382B15E8
MTAGQPAVCAGEETLSITVGTFKTHLTNVQAKPGARNRLEIAAWAWRNGVVEHGT